MTDPYEPWPETPAGVRLLEMVMTTSTEHQPLTLLTGPDPCLDRDCDEYFTEAGDYDPGVERCSHIKEQQICGVCSTVSPEGMYEHLIAWVCPAREQLL